MRAVTKNPIGSIGPSDWLMGTTVTALTAHNVADENAVWAAALGALAGAWWFGIAAYYWMRRGGSL